MKVLSGQSLIDIAIQELGSAEGAFDIAALNEISVTDELMDGQELKLPNVTNKSIATYYKNKSIKPATSGNEVIDNVERVFFEELPIEFT